MAARVMEKLFLAVFLHSLWLGNFCVLADSNGGADNGSQAFFVMRHRFYQENIRDTSVALQHLMNTRCHADRIVVAFEQRMMMRLGVAPGQLGLRDEGCAAVSNGSHYTLSIEFEKMRLCQSRFNQSQGLVENMVKIRPPANYLYNELVDDEDSAIDGSNSEVSGSGEERQQRRQQQQQRQRLQAIEIPFSCQYKEMISPPSTVLPTRRKPAAAAELLDGSNLFTLQLFQSKSFTQAFRPTMLSIPDDTYLYGQVKPNSSTIFEKAVIYSCYFDSGGQRSYIIQAGCPTDPDVEFFDDYPGMAETQFQLKIKKSYTPGLFVQFLCEIEACTMTANLEPSPLRKCESQSRYCSAPSTSPQLMTVQWPFSVKVVQAISNSAYDETPKNRCSPQQLRRQATPCRCDRLRSQNSVPTQMTVSLLTAVTVSVASFTFGCLTVALMWLIWKRVRVKSYSPAVSKQDLDKQLGSVSARLLQDASISQSAPKSDS